MSINEAYKYLRIMQPRYRKARRKEKGRLLTEMRQITGLHRKYLIQLMNGPPPERKKRGRQRGRKYGAQVDDAIRVIGKALDWVCAERLKPALSKMARHLAKFGELRVTAELLEQLEQIVLVHREMEKCLVRVSWYPPIPIAPAVGFGTRCLSRSRDRARCRLTLRRSRASSNLRSRWAKMASSRPSSLSFGAT